MIDLDELERLAKAAVAFTDAWQPAVALELLRELREARARAEQAERERDAIAEESVRHAIAESQRVYLNPSTDLRARYDRLREAAREVVREYEDCGWGKESHDAIRDLAEEVGETTQKPAIADGPAGGGR